MMGDGSTAMAVEAAPFYCSLMSPVNAVDGMSDLLLSRPNPALLQAFARQRRQEQCPPARTVILEVYRKAIAKHGALTNPYDADKLVSVSLPVFLDSSDDGLAMRMAFAKHTAARMLSLHRLEDCAHLLDSFNCCVSADSAVATPTDIEWTFYELVVQAQQTYTDYAKAYAKGNAVAFEAKAAIPGASDRYRQWLSGVTRMADRFAVLAERLLEIAAELPIKDKGVFEGHAGLLASVRQMYDEQVRLQLQLVRQQLQ